ncbi:bifunctional aspartate kinase/diaminopimelate decarboxylase [Pseudomarimonas salicorniae]|uniref:Diaminopimelate decarboxylase n=1 Tax=Pseudomarimonas salicorniae TaxID=2933270 RepID=A0ABT0GK93_9GAMM|nr:bifunctional aspartate kinase/diaminopimelate decarboxylase [Lysobacter sp. CAU 1642]MCK7594961.1 bifunctional aspartate kinase/diaminopimelate decarboxylase [Lysobacter sp. CAU 1642]
MSEGQGVPAASRWVVLKFGGTSVSQRTRWDQIGARIRERRAEGHRVLVVVSALSGVTNALTSLVAPGKPEAGRVAEAAALAQRHRDFAVTLDLDAETVIGDLLARLAALAVDSRAQAEEALQLAWQAEVFGLGELLSSRLGQAYLAAADLPLRWADARDWLRAVQLPHQSAWASRLSVNCRIDADADWRQRFAAQGDCLITQGFIARDEQGGDCILGRGGSDTSAAYFGALLGADRVEIWTDVPGMFSANPRVVPKARLLSRLDYAEAQEIATTGAKVLHPRCIGPCRESRVPLWIRDTEHPQLAGTVIDASAATMPGVKAISSRKGIVLVSMETVGMWQQVGFLADVFTTFKKHGLSVDLIGSAETNVTVSLDPSDNLVTSNVLDALCRDLEQICRVKVIAPAAAITLVGRGMRSLLHRLSPVLASFGRERVHLISQSSNDLNLTFVVDEALESGMMPHLHEQLVQSGAMPTWEQQVFGPSWSELRAPPAQAEPLWWERATATLKRHAAHGTPRYVYHPGIVRRRARELAGIGAIDQRFFAIKANPHPGILRVLEAEGFGFECVSLGELRHVREALPGLSPERILFTPSFAPVDEYAAALDGGVNVTVDNAALLRAAPGVFRGRRLLLRLDPGFGEGHHEKVRTGGREAKFGLPLDGLPEFLAALREVDARIIGLHAHIGSGILEAGHWREVYARLASVADSLGSVEVIDVGGGLGVSYEPGGDRFDLDGYAAMLGEMKATWPQYRLWVEPGRYLVAEAGVLLARITQVVEKSGVRRIGLDAGMHSLLRPALYNAWHRIENLSRQGESEGEPAEVVGPICETGDVLGRRRRLPDSSAPGDLVAIGHAGAYGAVMASRYNLRGLPEEDLIEEPLDE